MMSIGSFWGVKIHDKIARSQWWEQDCTFSCHTERGSRWANWHSKADYYSTRISARSPKLPQSGVRPSGLSFVSSRNRISPKARLPRGDVGHRSPNPQASKMAPQVKKTKKMLSKAAARTVIVMLPSQTALCEIEKQFEAPAKKSVAATDEKDKSKVANLLPWTLIKDATGLAFSSSCGYIWSATFGLTCHCLTGDCRPADWRITYYISSFIFY